MGSELTLRTFSETRLTFLQDTLESLSDPEAEIEQRLRIANMLRELARWKESDDQLRPALGEAGTLSNSSLVATDLNNLARLLKHTNRIKEAEPLMRRAFEIPNTFRLQTGHEHPNFQTAIANYQGLQQIMKPD